MHSSHSHSPPAPAVGNSATFSSFGVIPASAAAMNNTSSTLPHSNLGTPSSHQQPPQQPHQFQYDQTVALTFHQIEYIIHAEVKYTQVQNAVNENGTDPSSTAPAPSSTLLPLLSITAEQRSTGDRWTSDFSSRYIEEMSLKTGNYKKFPLFVRMLSSALEKKSENVFIDLLTFKDLEELKVRKQQGGGNALAAQPPQQQKNAVAAAQNKRYIILTYVAEFDKVHYPLPLKFESEPSPSSLQSTIQRLRSELDLTRAHYSQLLQTSQFNQGEMERDKQEVEKVKEENRKLKEMILKGSERNGDTTTAASSSSDPSASSSSPHHSSLASLQLELNTLRSQLDTSHQAHTDLARQLASVLAGGKLEEEGMQHTLEVLSAQSSQYREELHHERTAHEALRKIKKKEQDVLMNELEKRIEAERMLRMKYRTLQEEFDQYIHTHPAKSTKHASSATNHFSTASPSRPVMTGPAQRRPISATPSSTTSNSRTSSPMPSGTRTATGGARGRSPSPLTNTIRHGRTSSPRPYDTDNTRRGRASSPTINNSGGARSRSSSPSLSNGARFDPSAYVKAKAAALVEQQARIAKVQREGRLAVSTSSDSRSRLSSTTEERPHQRERSRSPSISSTPSSRQNSERNLSQTMNVTPSRQHQRPPLPTSSSSSTTVASRPAISRAHSTSTTSASTSALTNSRSSTKSPSSRPSSRPSSSSGRAQSPQLQQSSGRSQGKMDLSDDEEEDVKSAPLPRPSSAGRSIDQRFSALQNFLQNQKSKATENE